MARVTSEELIRVAMAKNGIHSIVELSQRSGVSRPKIYEYLTGASPYQKAIEKLAEVLSVQPEDLLDGDKY